MTELNIVEDKALREQVAGRVEVLDKKYQLNAAEIFEKSKVEFKGV